MEDEGILGDGGDEVLLAAIMRRRAAVIFPATSGNDSEIPLVIEPFRALFLMFFKNRGN
jgi:hypothetical protein